MSRTVTLPPMPPEVADAFAAFPAGARAQLEALRALIFETAETEAVGPLTETLKWGEPAYLTEATRTGSTLRLGTAKGAPDTCAIFVNCQTSLADQFRDIFGDVLDIQDHRAVLIPADAPLDRNVIGACIAMALTYRRARTARAARRRSRA